MSDKFRQRVLTILGAIGYLVALAMMVVDIMPEFSVPMRTVFLALLTSSALLGVDYGIDVVNFLGSSPNRPEKPTQRDSETGNHEATNDRERGQS